LLERYLGSVKRLKNPTTAAALEKYRAMAQHFRTYADQYGSDWLLAVAQGFQESELDHSRRSSAGAVGVMQVKPSTAADPNVGIDDVEVLENNIHASIKYMSFLRERYFADEEIAPLDQGLLTLAAYNAGPARVATLRQKAAAVGLDRNQWFGNVEIIAAREIGRETVDYVSNIYKYYSAYKAVVAQREAAVTAADYEPARVFRRLQPLRGWSDEQVYEIFTGSSGTGGAAGVRARAGVRLAVVGDRLDRGEDWLYAGDVASLGAATRDG
jgi:membrane-bound lytic murein transglycosylase MltF